MSRPSVFGTWRGRFRQAGKSSLLVVGLTAALTGLFPSESSAWWNDQWAFRKKITIDASGQPGPDGKPQGVRIAEPIGTAPILVRLHQGNFTFQEAKENCGDFRFVTADDKTPLNYQTEKCDPLLNEALVWVKLKDIAPGAKTEFWMYWGNKNAPALSSQDAKAVYDPETVLNYHFDERNAPAADSTVWGNTAQTIGQPAEGSIIGRGLRLSGQSITLPPAASLAWPDATALTWSAWIKMAAPQPNAVIYSRRNLAAGFIVGVDNGVPYVEVATGAGTQRASAGAPIDAAKWYHLTVTADGAQVVMYVNGAPVASLAASLPALASIAFLGGDTVVAVAPAPVPAPSAADGAAPPADQGGQPAAAPPSPAAPAADGTAAPADASAPATVPEAPALAAAAPPVGFIGDIDELTIAKIVRPIGFIKLAAIGQGGSQMAQLILYSVNQQNDAWFTGYLAVLLKSVTIDGWVVISILGVIFIASWWVMIGKNAYLSRRAKANILFTERFRVLSADLGVIDRGGDFKLLTETGGQVTPADRKMVQYSPLFHLYRAGMEEIRNRTDRPGQANVLSAPALAAIRSTLDGVLIRESQSLRSRLIVLTIAIAGGPFLGLLGTVIGVMVTFASIALAGEVNVNAIAPGVAGALVATVAGLIVAIPALFGYNLLINRVNNLTSDMQVFADEFITKMSEYYSDRPEPAPLQRLAAE